MTASSPIRFSAVAEELRSAGLLVAVRGREDVAVEGVSQDSRSVGPGDLFLAWVGTAHDAHDFVADAADAGAVAAVVERFVPDAAVPQLRVVDGRAAAALVADRVLGRPGRRLQLVGVTGTNGKTTTTVLARHLLQRSRPAAAVGTLGLLEPSGDVRAGTEGLTTPGPVRIARWMRSLVDEGVEAVVVEASSHALEQRRLDGLRFATAVYTNLTRDHLDYHESEEAYFAAKARLLGLVREEGAVVVHAGVEAWEELPVGRLRTVRYTAGDEPADLRARDVEPGVDGCRFRMETDDGAAEVRMPLPGRFNVENALAAVGAALAAGVSLDEAAAGLAEAPQVPGRLEVVVREPFTVLIDYAHTPDALERVLAALRPVVPGRLTVVFGAGGDRDREKRPLMGRAVAGAADRIVVTSDNPRSEDPDRIIDDIEPGLEGVSHVRITERREAIAHVLETAREDEVILLAGKGHERYQEIGSERRPFDERVVVRELLSGDEAA